MARASHDATKSGETLDIDRPQGFDWSEVLNAIADGKVLSGDTANRAMSEILAGAASDVHIAAFLMGLRTRGETPEEISAFVDAMLATATPLELSVDDAVDIVGTGGSIRRRTRALNVSTAAAIVAGACGAHVCKHGNRRASSTSGSTDVLEALGIGVDLDAAGVARCVDEIGVGFAFARMFHPAMRFAAPARSALGIPTVFNILGPLANPARVRRGVVGVGDPDRMDLVAATLSTRNPDRFWVVHGEVGFDELCTSGPTRVLELVGDTVNEFTLSPIDIGVPAVNSEDLRGGSPEENAAVIEEVFAGVSSPEADLIAVNAAAALVVADLAESLVDAVALTRRALAEGRARDVLDRLRVLTNP